MNPLRLLLFITLSIGWASTGSASELLPTWKFENHTASDGAETQCLVIQPTAGIIYEIQSSEQLSSWETETKFHCIGETSFAFPMRRLVPLPPPDPEAPPLSAPPAPVTVALMLSVCSSDGGGTVLSWPSLEIEGAPPLVVRIAAGMDAAWNDLPICVQVFGGHEFALFRTGMALPAPAENSATSGKDTAMLAAFEENFAAMNQAVADHAATATHPLKPAPGVTPPARFFRIIAHRIDSDGDGTPDDLEFANLSHAPAADGLVSNPFDADSNKDGIPDGDQFDSDHDGTVDSKDLAPGNSNDAAEIIEIPRYAFFEAQGNPFQISDRGTVVFGNGTWQGGHFIPFSSGVRGLGINDNDWVVGEKLIPIPDADIPYPYSDRVLHIQTPGHPMAKVTGTGGDYAGSIALTPGQPGLLSNDGICMGRVIQTQGPYEYQNTEDPRNSWQLVPGGENSSPVSREPYWALDNSLGWTWGGTVFDQGNELAALEFEPSRVIRDAKNPDLLTAFRSGGGAYTSKGGGWTESEKYRWAVDIADDGTAIGVNNIVMPDSEFPKKLPLQINGIWSDIRRTAPEIPTAQLNPWLDETAGLIDISPKGWVLARRGYWSEDAEGHLDQNYPQMQAGILLPIRVKGKEDPLYPKASGVDAFSIGSNDPGDAVKDRIWIMAPAPYQDNDGNPTPGSAGSSDMQLEAPLNINTPLTLSAPSITFNTLDLLDIHGANNNILVKATNPASSGQDLLLKLEMGPSVSISHPIGLKIMKARTVKVVLHKVTKTGPVYIDSNGIPAFSSNPPDLAPAALEVEKFLNGVFEPQVNVRFSVSYGKEVAVNRDLNGTESMDNIGEDELSPEENLILTELNKDGGDPNQGNIDVFLLGTDYGINVGQLWGLTSRNARKCWVVADALLGKPAPHVMDTVAHEIGHVFVDYGHPDDSVNPGVAPLLGTKHEERLMMSGGGGTRGYRLVKREWDEAEAWLDEHIDQKKL